jgi:hypothetical protein
MLGEHTAGVLRDWLGWSEDQINRFESDREKATDSEAAT